MSVESPTRTCGEAGCHSGTKRTRRPFYGNLAVRDPGRPAKYRRRIGDDALAGNYHADPRTDGSCEPYQGERLSAAMRRIPGNGCGRTVNR